MPTKILSVLFPKRDYGIGMRDETRLSSDLFLSFEQESRSLTQDSRFAAQRYP